MIVSFTLISKPCVIHFFWRLCSIPNPSTWSIIVSLCRRNTSRSVLHTLFDIWSGFQLLPQVSFAKVKRKYENEAFTRQQSWYSTKKKATRVLILSRNGAQHKFFSLGFLFFNVCKGRGTWKEELLCSYYLTESCKSCFFVCTVRRLVIL
jgi:hypothetical protein